MAVIPFQYISTTNTRIPGVEAEVDPSRANTGQGAIATLIMGQITSSGTFVAGTPILSQGVLHAQQGGGNGSMLALALAKYRESDPFGQVWLLPLADDPAAVAATGTITAATPPTAAGSLVYYIGGQRVVQAVTAGMATTAIATALAATINAQVTLPVTATAATSVVTLTAKNKGICGNDILILPNYYGAAAGEAYPAGYTDTIVAMASGATNPVLTTPLLNLGDLPIEVYALPYNDAVSITAISAFLNDATGRWAPQVMLYGHAINAYRGTVGTLTTFGLTQNGQHISTMGFNGSADPYWLWSASIAGQVAMSVRANPAQPFNTLPLTVAAPPIASRFIWSDRNTLLFDGISTFLVGQGGTVRIERLITNYQKNAVGAVDDSFLNTERMFQLAQVIRLIKNFQLSTFPRAIVVADNSPVPVNSSYVNSLTVRAAVIGYYQELEALGIVTDSVSFAAGIQVINAGAGIFTELLPITLPNQLEMIAMKVQFKAA